MSAFGREVRDRFRPLADLGRPGCVRPTPDRRASLDPGVEQAESQVVARGPRLGPFHVHDVSRTVARHFELIDDRIVPGLAVDFFDTWAKGSVYFASLGLEYPIAQAALALLCLVALLSPRERVQVAVWLLVVGYQSSRIVRFFDHPA
jgi:hypothetical protein